MRNLALATLLLVLSGCASTVEKGNLQSVPSGERVTIVSPVKIIETRGPLALKLEWQLLPGSYIEKYSGPWGRVFVSDGRLVQFTSTLGDKQMRVGGFIELKEKPGHAKLYVAREYQDRPQVLANFVAGKATDAGALVPITDFELKDIAKR